MACLECKAIRVLDINVPLSYDKFISTEFCSFKNVDLLLFWIDIFEILPKLSLEKLLRNEIPVVKATLEENVYFIWVEEFFEKTLSYF